MNFGWLQEFLDPAKHFLFRENCAVVCDLVRFLTASCTYKGEIATTLPKMVWDGTLPRIMFLRLEKE